MYLPSKFKAVKQHAILEAMEIDTHPYTPQAYLSRNMVV